MGRKIFYTKKGSTDDVETSNGDLIVNYEKDNEQIMVKNSNGETIILNSTDGGTY